MAKKSVDSYVADAEKSYADSLKLTGDKRFRKLMRSANAYGAAAGLETDTNEQSELYMQARDTALDALEIKPEDKRASNAGDRYNTLARGLESTVGSENSAETAIFGVTLAASFIFGVDLLSHNITGSAIASGNTPVDIGAGALLLLASIVGVYFLINSKVSKPMPHPEKKKKKSKKSKKK